MSGMSNAIKRISNVFVQSTDSLLFEFSVSVSQSIKRKTIKWLTEL